MAATCAGVAWFGAPRASLQNPRALMMSAGVCGFGSLFWLEADCFAFADGTIWASAEASWTVAAAAGFARGIGTGSVDLAGAAGAVLSAATAAFAPSSSSSFDLLLNNAANRPSLLIGEAPSPLPRFSMSARAN